MSCNITLLDMKICILQFIVHIIKICLPDIHICLIYGSIYVSDRHKHKNRKILFEPSVETLLRIQFYLLNAEFHLMSALNNGWGYNTEYEEGGCFLFCVSYCLLRLGGETEAVELFSKLLFSNSSPELLRGL